MRSKRFSALFVIAALCLSGCADSTFTGVTLNLQAEQESSTENSNHSHSEESKKYSYDELDVDIPDDFNSFPGTATESVEESSEETEFVEIIFED